MGYVEAKKGAWGLAFDFMYMDLARGAELENPIPGGPPLGADFGKPPPLPPPNNTLLLKVEYWNSIGPPNVVA